LKNEAIIYYSLNHGSYKDASETMKTQKKTFYSSCIDLSIQRCSYGSLTLCSQDTVARLTQFHDTHYLYTVRDLLDWKQHPIIGSTS